MTDQKNGQEYLSFVLEKLQARLAEISQSLLDGQKEIENMHDYYWQNYTEMDQYGYEDYDNQQALLHQVNANQEQLLLRSRFRKMLDSPFFGRVDFCYDGDDEPEIFYIGIGNFAERPGELPLIYDWRSPVSGLFYDFDRGPASYLAPGGEMTGEICSKWQYKIRDGKMIYGFESDVKIDDDILKAELGSNGEVQLKNIIRTIQKEQNAIIRNTKDRILVIQGAAGSGKTSVALHRIAYLLYHDRQNLKSSNILILSPNGVFSDYISHILPELGEENIQEMSFDLFAYRKLQDTAADCEDRCDQIEREMRDPKAAERFALKQSQAFVDQMEGFALELEDELMNFSDVSYKSFVKSESEIITLFYDKFADIPLLSRMDAVAETFIDEIETLLNRDLPEEELDRFRAMYCGLCHTLSRRYGQAARFILNYDFTYLAILLSDGTAGAQGAGRCYTSPIKKRPFLEPTAAMELAADESVILAYWQLRDGVEDHAWASGLKYRAGARLLESAYKRAAALRPEFDQAVRRQLQLLSALEQAKDPSMDRAADSFAVLLSSAAEELTDPVRKRIMEQILYHLGRWIYLIDGADDLKKDAESGNYNPVALRYGLTDGTWTPESRRDFATTLDHSIHQMAAAFELWDFGVWTPVLQSTFYGGLFQVGKAVLDGSFHRPSRKNIREFEETE